MTIYIDNYVGEYEFWFKGNLVLDDFWKLKK